MATAFMGKKKKLSNNSGSDSKSLYYDGSEWDDAERGEILKLGLKIIFSIAVAHALIFGAVYATNKEFRANWNNSGIYNHNSQSHQQPKLGIG